MADRRAQLDAIAAQLDAIEQELKQIGYWTAQPPDLLREVAAGRIKSYLDAPAFELWLQCIFLPRARQAVQTDSLPADSQVGVMALRQYDYHSYAPEAQRLLALLYEFDKLVRAVGPSASSP